jgi:hypothetical protein
VEQGLERRAARAIWPALAVVSTWADGPSAGLLAELAPWLEGVVVEPKGLLATEGVVSVPFSPSAGMDRGCALALTSHVIELLPLDAEDSAPPLEGARTIRPDEAELGRRYSLVLTTSAGLVRYHLEDVVELVAPLRIRFVGKLDHVSDRVGEKLHAARVGAVLDAAFAAAAAGGRPRGASCLGALDAVAAGEAPRYVVCVDAEVPPDVARSLAADVERALLEGHAYAYARALGQLAPVVAARVRGLAERRVALEVAAGRRAGDVKLGPLEARPAVTAALVGAAADG